MAETRPIPVQCRHCGEWIVYRARSDEVRNRGIRCDSCGRGMMLRVRRNFSLEVVLPGEQKSQMPNPKPREGGRYATARRMLRDPTINWIRRTRPPGGEEET